jgi:murein DD-endopeptidase MepM/ murein hydrolase activator NlpD
MRKRTTDHRGWSASRRSRFGSRALLLILVLSSLGGFFTSVTPRAASADDLDDAYDRQSQLQKLINRQKSSISNLTANQAELTRRIADTKDTLKDIHANLLAVRTQIVGMTVDIARSQNAVDELEATATKLEAELAQIKAEETQKAEELEASKALLAARIREAYDTDRTSMLDSFLSGKDFTDVLTEVGYHLDFAEQDKVLAEKIESDQKTLAVMHENVVLAQDQTDELYALAAKAKAQLDEQLAALAETRRELARLEAETQRLLRSQQAAYARMARDKAAMAKKLAASREAQDLLEALIARLVREQLAKGGIPSEYNGTFIWPMQGHVTQEFGCTGFGMEPPLGGCRHFHRGIDIANDMYTPIRAAGAGKVIWSGRSPYDPSWVVIIAHSSQLVTWYAHIDNKSHPPRVHTGQYVAQGEVVAYEGMTGWTTGPHLHWAVQLSGNWVNPRLFLPRN